jgi:hypothetical protein
VNDSLDGIDELFALDLELFGEAFDVSHTWILWGS